MSTIIDRIKDLCLQMRMSENKLANEIGVNTQTLNNYTTGKRGVSYDVVDKILVRFPQVSAEWLIRGIGSMLCGCPPDDPSLYADSPSAPIDGVSTEAQRTYNGLATEADKDKEIAMLRQLLDEKERTIRAKDQTIELLLSQREGKE